MPNTKIQTIFSNNPDLDPKLAVKELSIHSEQELKLATDIYTNKSYVCIEEDESYKIFDPEVLEWFEYSGEDKESFKISEVNFN